MATTRSVRDASTGHPEIDALLFFLSRTLVTMSEANDEDEALEALARLVAQTGLVERMTISLVEDTDPDVLRVITLVDNKTLQFGVPGIPVQMIHPLRAQSLADAALTTNRTVSWSSHDPLDLHTLSRASQESYKSFLERGLVCGTVVPLRSGRIEIGCLQVYGSNPAGFSSNFQVALTRLGEIIGMTIDKTRLIGALRTELDDAGLANNKLESSNRDLEEFAYVASHDLQEPLRKIRAFGGRLETKAGDRLTEQEMDYLHRMQESAGRMQTLINDLLHFSRVKTATANPGILDLNNVVADVLADLEVAIEEADGVLEASHLPTIVADPSQTRQLIQNLVGNAVKFRRPGVAPIIRIGSRVSEHGDLSIFVADNGIGFEEKYMEKIFKPFQRLHGRHEYSGSGIGLAVCHRIAERQGAELTAVSQPGEGSTFTIHFTKASLDEAREKLTTKMVGA